MLILLIALPLLTGLAAALPFPSRRGRLTFLLTMQIIETALVVWTLVSGRSYTTNIWHLTESLTIAMKLDGVAAVFSALTAVAWLLALIYSVEYMSHSQNEARFYVFLFLSEGMLLGTALSADFVSMYVFYELTSLCSMPLVLHELTHDAVTGAMKYLYYSIGGAFFVLFGIVVLYTNTSTLDFAPGGTLIAGQHTGLELLAVFFVVLGFGTKAGLFPMHTWLPDAHSQAPSPVSALLSGVLLKCAMLVIMRFYGFTIQAVGAEYPQLLLLIVGTLSILVAALSMFRQDDLKRRFAYSSVENVGVIALCLGIGGPLGIAAALLHCVFHGFTKTLAFCVSGNIQHAFGTRSLAKIQGVVEVAPATAALAILALLGLAAFPPFGMFISEFLTFVAGVTAGPMWLVVVVALGLTVAISALTRIALKSVFGHAPQGMGKHEAPALMLIPEIILAVMILWFGIATPLPLVHGVETATGIVLEQSTEELHATPMYRAVFGTETAQSEVE